MIQKAKEFAKEAHKLQKRKYTGEPYFVHLDEVANLVELVGGTEPMIVAAYLHDVIEDTSTTLETIKKEFGWYSALLVNWLTDISKPSDGNREIRKNMDRCHLAMAIPEAKTIKLADLISNAKSIVQHDRHFAVVYLKEKELLLPFLKEGNQILYKMAGDILIQSKLALMET